MKLEQEVYQVLIPKIEINTDFKLFAYAEYSRSVKCFKQLLYKFVKKYPPPPPKNILASLLPPSAPKGASDGIRACYISTINVTVIITDRATGLAC